MSSRYEPQEPPNTCPAIDNVLAAVNEALRVVNLIDHPLASQVDDAMAHVGGHMEWIRTNAEKLREWGQHHQKQAERNQEIIDDLEAQVSSLSEQLAEAQSE